MIPIACTTYSTRLSSRERPEPETCSRREMRMAVNSPEPPPDGNYMLDDVGNLWTGKSWSSFLWRLAGSDARRCKSWHGHNRGLTTE
jgi:hypothetical protein